MRRGTALCVLLAVSALGCANAPPAPAPAVVVAEEHPLEERFRRAVIPPRESPGPAYFFEGHAKVIGDGEIYLGDADVELVAPGPPLGPGPIELDLRTPVPELRVQADGLGEIRMFCEEAPGARTYPRGSRWGRRRSFFQFKPILGTRREREDPWCDRS
jgi:hypothetical protein